MSMRKPRTSTTQKTQEAGNSTVLAIRAERPKYAAQLTKLQATLPKVIEDAAACGKAETGLANITLALKEVTTKRDSFTKPLKATVKLLEAEFKPVLTALTLMSDTVRRQLSIWRSVEADQKEAERAKLEAANAKRRIPVDVALVVPPQEKTHVTEAGSTVQYRKDYAVQVDDINLVPVEYLYREVAEGKVKLACRDAVATGHPLPTIPGLTITAIEIPAMSL